MTDSHRMTKIRVAVLAEEPLGWGSGKQYFPLILNKYQWTSDNATYTFHVDYIYDKDIRKGKLTTSSYDVLLVPGGGVGDAEAIVKGIPINIKARKWKKQISTFIREGGGYVGICGGAALFTDLIVGDTRKPRTFLERVYNRSSLHLSCVSSYYKTLACPLFYPVQRSHPEKIGAAAYVFSFAPGYTSKGTRIHSGGVPLECHINKNHPLFNGFPYDTECMRWWGGPALVVPDKPDREVAVLANYPSQDPSDNTATQIDAWIYVGGVIGFFKAFLKAWKFILTHKDTVKNVLLYTYFMAGPWIPSDKKISLGYANRPCMTAEIYPNRNKGRILLCATHPEYMIWRDGYIEETHASPDTSLATGLYYWKNIKPLSKSQDIDVTYGWWLVRRCVAWAGKVPARHLPPITKTSITQKQESAIKNNIFWDGSLRNQMINI